MDIGYIVVAIVIIIGSLGLFFEIYGKARKHDELRSSLDSINANKREIESEINFKKGELQKLPIRRTIRLVLIIYCFLLLAVFFYVPWSYQVRIGDVPLGRRGHSFIWNIPELGKIDFGMLLVEVGILTILSLLTIVMFWKRNNYQKFTEK